MGSKLQSLEAITQATAFCLDETLFQTLVLKEVRREERYVQGGHKAERRARRGGGGVSRGGKEEERGGG